VGGVGRRIIAVTSFPARPRQELCEIGPIGPATIDPCLASDERGNGARQVAECVPNRRKSSVRLSPASESRGRGAVAGHGSDLSEVHVQNDGRGNVGKNTDRGPSFPSVHRRRPTRVRQTSRGIVVGQRVPMLVTESSSVRAWTCPSTIGPPNHETDPFYGLVPKAGWHRPGAGRGKRQLCPSLSVIPSTNGRPRVCRHAASTNWPAATRMTAGCVTRRDGRATHRRERRPSR
jgi:hypothetical protein